MNPTVPANETPLPASRLRTPISAFWMLLATPFLVGFGTFITVAMQPFVNTVSAKGDAVLMTWVGAILLCVGVSFFIVGLVLLGIRSLMQQQMELLRGARAEHHDA